MIICINSVIPVGDVAEFLKINLKKGKKCLYLGLKESRLNYIKRTFGDLEDLTVLDLTGINFSNELNSELNESVRNKDFDWCYVDDTGHFYNEVHRGLIDEIDCMSNEKVFVFISPIKDLYQSKIHKVIYSDNGDDIRKAALSQSQSSNSDIKCPKCFELTQKEAVFCSKCGAKVHTESIIDRLDLKTPPGYIGIQLGLMPYRDRKKLEEYNISDVIEWVAKCEDCKKCRLLKNRNEIYVCVKYHEYFVKKDGWCKEWKYNYFHCDHCNLYIKVRKCPVCGKRGKRI